MKAIRRYGLEFLETLGTYEEWRSYILDILQDDEVAHFGTYSVNDRPFTGVSIYKKEDIKEDEDN